MHLYRRAVEKVPLFRNKEPQLITAIVTCLQLQYYAPVGFAQLLGPSAWLPAKLLYGNGAC